MKTKSLSFFWIVVGAVTICDSVQAWAQDIPTDLQIVKYSWVKEAVGAVDPFGVPIETYNQARDRVRDERRQSPVRQAAANAEKETESKPQGPPRYAFKYVMVVHNQAVKTIKEIDWDYVFTDEKTGDELGRRQFTSVEKVGASKRKELIVRVTAPPTHSISAYSMGKNERAGLVEKIEIRRILYDDGSVWVAN